MTTAAKTDQRYWLKKLTKRADVWGARIAFRGQRHYFTLSQDKHDSAKKAADAYKALLAKGWPAVLAEHSRIDRTPEPEKAAATVTLGRYLEAAGETLNASKVTRRTWQNYTRAVRLIVGEMAEIEKSKARFAASRGAKVWRNAIDEIPLASITPERIAAWQKMRLDAAGDDELKRRRATITSNANLARAKSLFGKRFTKNLPLAIPSPAPFSDVEFSERASMRYSSRIDPQIVLARAVAELDAEPLKIVMLALCAGLRAGEIDGLRWNLLDLDAGKITIATTESFAAKSQDSLGDVELDAGFVALLRGWKARATGPFVVEAPNPKPGKVRWIEARRAHRHFQAVYEWLRGLEIAGERPLAGSPMPLHTLRKEAGSAVNQRHGLAAASMFLRHSDIGITSRHYVGKKERHTTGFFSTPENVIPIDPAPPADRTERQA